MLFIMDINGTVTRASTEPLYQGSSDVNKITLLAPFTLGTVITVNFQLPNGQYVYPYVAFPAENPYTMTPLDNFPGFTDESGKRWNAWEINVDYPLTQFAGTLTMRFEVRVPTGNNIYGTLTSSITMQTVGEGIPSISPTVTPEDLNTVIQYVTLAGMYRDQVEQMALPLEKGTGKQSVQQTDNEAISENAVAFGIGTLAGCRAFTVKSYNDNTIVLNDATGISDIVNNKPYCSIVATINYKDGTSEKKGMSDVWYNFAQILSIADNVITLSKSVAFESDVTIQSVDKVVLFDHPELGDTDYGLWALSTGEGSKAMGKKSRASGDESIAIGNDAIAEGHTCFATTYARATGVGSRANFRSSEASGRHTEANGFGASAKGGKSKAYGSFSSAEGYESVAGDENNDSFSYKISESNCVAAHAEGIRTVAFSTGSHAQGKETVAGTRGYSIKEVQLNGGRLVVETVEGLQEGFKVQIVANGVYSAIVGTVSLKNNRFSISETLSDLVLVTDDNGNVLTTNPDTGMPVNYLTVVGNPSLGNIEVAPYADASGLGTVAFGTATSARGTYNKDLGQDYIDYVGNGTSNENRSNAYTLDRYGNATFAGQVFVNGGEPISGGGGQKLYRHDIYMYSDGEYTDCYMAVCLTVYDTNPNSYGIYGSEDEPLAAKDFPFINTGFPPTCATGLCRPNHYSDGLGIVSYARHGGSAINFLVAIPRSGDPYYYEYTVPCADIEGIEDRVTEVM